MNKKAVSPVVATVLLIVIVVVLATVIFLWARGFVSESITKDSKSSDQACSEISLEATYSGSELIIINNGDINVYAVEVRVTSDASEDTLNPSDSIYAGESIVITGLTIPLGVSEIQVIPVILGTSSSGEKKAFTCKNYGVIAELI